jgi:predicted oxidoreductase (fatty acid repression mutant protein)
MNQLFIPLTLTRNSKKISINVKDILKYSPTTFSSGSVVYLIEKSDGRDFLIVNESVLEIDELVVNEWDSKYGNLLD